MTGKGYGGITKVRAQSHAVNVLNNSGAVLCSAKTEISAHSAGEPLAFADVLKAGGHNIKKPGDPEGCRVRDWFVRVTDQLAVQLATSSSYLPVIQPNA